MDRFGWEKVQYRASMNHKLTTIQIFLAWESVCVCISDSLSFFLVSFKNLLHNGISAQADNFPFLTLASYNSYSHLVYCSLMKHYCCCYCCYLNSRWNIRLFPHARWLVWKQFQLRSYHYYYYCCKTLSLSKVGYCFNSHSYCLRY